MICDKQKYSPPEEALEAFKIYSVVRIPIKTKRKKRAKAIYKCNICGFYHLTSRKSKKTLTPKDTKVKYKKWLN